MGELLSSRRGRCDRIRRALACSSRMGAGESGPCLPMSLLKTEMNRQALSTLTAGYNVFLTFVRPIMVAPLQGALRFWLVPGVETPG
jgi:hypothetical protein